MASYRPRIPSSPAFEAIRRRLEWALSAARGPLAWAGVVAFLFVATVLATRPLAWSLGSGTLTALEPVAPDALRASNGALDTWIMAWGSKAFAADPFSFFQAPFFYPASNTLAFSENLVGNLPLFGPLFALSSDAFWAANAFILLSAFLTVVASFVLTLHLTRSRLVALVAALCFALSPARLSLLPQMQVAGIWWSPLAIWMASRFLERGRWKDALLAAAFLVAQFASSISLGCFLLLAMSATLALRLRREPMLRRRDLTVKGAVAAALAAVALLPLLLPYLHHSEVWGTPLGADLASALSAWPALLLALAMALIAGYSATLALRRWGKSPSRRAGVGLVLVVSALATTWIHPLTLYPRPRATQLDAFLARRAEGPVITLPMPGYGGEVDRGLETSRMIGSLIHGLPLVSGTSGFTPPSFLDLARKLEQGPSPQALDALAAIGVKTLVIRFDQMPLGLRERWRFDRDPSALGLVPLWFEENVAAVYHIVRKPKPADLLYATLLLPERLPAGWQFTLGMALNVPGKTIWVAPFPPERQPLTVRWEGPARTQVTKPVWVPLTVEGPETVGIPLRTPSAPGRYRLTVEGASLRATASVEVANWQAADSLSRPLDARMTWVKPQPSDKVVPGTVMPLRWEVLNQGEGVWRSRTTWRQRLASHPEWLREHPRRIVERGAGEVMLEVRWRKRRTEAELMEGHSRVRRFPLRHDVFPGQRYVFAESLFVPEQPGGYIVELRLTDAFGTLSTPVERREVLVHELAELRDFLKNFEGR